ncbi:MAG: sugar ABC transporter permease [Proteobacteria bacterium]|nr:sugar ABC transporter permease [Pseudomonadota bacterium]MBI3497748.1 sugar ABC transporter permease [Pseudomonadota bacterium]
MTDRFWRKATLAPTIVVYAGMALFPVLNLIAMSVHDITWAGGAAQWRFVGFAHYAHLPDDVLLRAGVVNTLLFAMGAVSVQMVLGFALAFATTQIDRGRTFYRALFMLPILVPGIVIGAIWKLMYNFDFGVLNQLWELLGGTAQDWLGQPALALPAVIAVDVWHWTPFVFLLMLAGLESLPQDIYEAARSDGATAWQELVHLTLPLMLPTIAVTLIFRLIVAFKVFDEVYLLTGGGPGTATEVLSFTIYRRFFQQDLTGPGAAMSIATLFILALAIVLASAVARRRAQYA